MQTEPVFLNGKFVTTESALSIIDPSTGEPFARMSTLGRPEIAQALRHAQAAFEEWRTQTAKTRGELLARIASELERRTDEIATSITRENGKPLAQSRAEVNMSVEHLRWFAEEARRAYGRIIPPQVPGKRHLVLKSPMGVAAAIAPWNFPLVLGVRKVAPALAAGCAVILKPASQTPLSSAAFAQCVATADAPAGIFQLVAGSAKEIAAELLENPICRKISFTGSTEVGKLLVRGAADQLKHLSLELGGQAPVLIFADADFDRAIEGALLAKFRNTGQSCIAANRLFVQRPVYEKFLDRFVEKTRALKVGPGLEPDAQIGPLIDEKAVAKAAEHVQNAVAKGAKALCGGKRISGRKGFFFEPTVLADVPGDSLCMREETFAPIAAVAPFETEAEGIRLANQLPYGLSAYLFTSNLDRAFRVMEKLEAGMIGLNDGVPTATHAPFGGVKQSGWGRELGSEGLEAFLETKHVSLGLAQE